jgi:hypothetical protein
MAKSTFFFPHFWRIKTSLISEILILASPFWRNFAKFLKKSELASALFSKKGAGSTFFQKGHT